MKHKYFLCFCFAFLFIINFSIISRAQSDLNTIGKLIEGIPPFPVVVERDNINPLPAVEEDYFGVPSSRIDTRHELTKSFEEIVAFSYDPTLLYPGALLQGKPLSQGLPPIGITLPRAPGVITMSNLQFKEPANYNASIANPSQATVETAYRKLLSQPLVGEQAARIFWDRSEMYSIDQGFLSVGVNAKYLTSSLRTSLEKNTFQKRTNYIIRLTQIYYDVSFERPTTPENFFSRNAKLNLAKTQMGIDNPPAYISTVSYGRMLFLFFSSDSSYEKVVSTIDAAVSAGFASLETNLKKEQQNIISTSKLTVLALGGSSSGTVDVLTNGVKGLDDYLKKGAAFSPKSQAFPISYIANYVRDGSLAKLGYSTNYTASAYQSLPTIKSLLVHFHTHGDDKDPAESVEMWVVNGTFEVKQISSFGLTFEYPTGVINGTEIGHQRWGQGEKWGNDGDNDFTIELSKPILLRECPNIHFRLRKNPDNSSGSGWRMSYQIIGLLYNGKSVTLVDRGEKLVGDGNQYDFYNETFNCPNPNVSTSNTLNEFFRLH